MFASEPSAAVQAPISDQKLQHQTHGSFRPKTDIRETVLLAEERRVWITPEAGASRVVPSSQRPVDEERRLSMWA